jgi:hypothetical protein
MGYKPHDQFADINLTTVNYTSVALTCETKLRINELSNLENIQVLELIVESNDLLDNPLGISHRFRQC